MRRRLSRGPDLAAAGGRHAMRGAVTPLATSARPQARQESSRAGRAGLCLRGPADQSRGRVPTEASEHDPCTKRQGFGGPSGSLWPAQGRAVVLRPSPGLCQQWAGVWAWDGPRAGEDMNLQAPWGLGWKESLARRGRGSLRSCGMAILQGRSCPARRRPRRPREDPGVLRGPGEAPRPCLSKPEERSERSPFRPQAFPCRRISFAEEEGRDPFPGPALPRARAGTEPGPWRSRVPGAGPGVPAANAAGNAWVPPSGPEQDNRARGASTCRILGGRRHGSGPRRQPS